MEIRRRSRENEQTNGFFLKSDKSLPVKSVLGQAADPWVSEAFRQARSIGLRDFHCQQNGEKGNSTDP